MKRYLVVALLVQLVLPRSTYAKEPLVGGGGFFVGFGLSYWLAGEATLGYRLDNGLCLIGTVHGRGLGSSYGRLSLSTSDVQDVGLQYVWPATKSTGFFGVFSPMVSVSAGRTMRDSSGNPPVDLMIGSFGVEFLTTTFFRPYVIGRQPFSSGSVYRSTEGNLAVGLTLYL